MRKTLANPAYTNAWFYQHPGMYNDINKNAQRAADTTGRKQRIFRNFDLGPDGEPVLVATVEPNETKMLAYGREQTPANIEADRLLDEQIAAYADMAADIG
jgi:hypothetical protein